MQGEWDVAERRYSREAERLEGLRRAAALLAQHGYGQVRAEELAEACGVSVGALYRRHGSKRGFVQHLRREVHSDLARRATQAWLGAPGAGADFQAAFMAAWSAVACWALAEPERFGATCLQSPPVKRTHSAARARAHAAWRADCREPEPAPEEDPYLEEEDDAWAHHEGCESHAHDGPCEVAPDWTPDSIPAADRAAWELLIYGETSVVLPPPEEPLRTSRLEATDGGPQPREWLARLLRDGARRGALRPAPRLASAGMERREVGSVGSDN